LWFVPINIKQYNHTGLGVAFDIEGLSSGFIVVSDRIKVSKPILIVTSKIRLAVITMEKLNGKSMNIITENVGED
jgi:hypothetical protein